MMIAVISGVSSQISLDLAAQEGIVLPLHLGEEGIEAVGGMDDAYLLVTRASVAPPGGGIDGRAAHPFFGDILARQEAGASARLRAVALEASAERRRYLFGSQRDIGFHNLIV